MQGYYCFAGVKIKKVVSIENHRMTPTPCKSIQLLTTTNYYIYEEKSSF